MSVEAKKIGVHKMFDAIAGTYDRVNRILSFGIDLYWRRKALSFFPKVPLRLLDIATGTGDQLLSALRHCEIEKGWGVDLSTGMLALGREKVRDPRIEMVVGDAMALPLPDASVNAITMSFGIRNVPSVGKCLGEMLRVLEPGGRAVVLEFSLPQNRLVRALHLLYLRRVLPKVGRLLSHHKTAYSYLNDTIETFPYGEALVELFKGFAKVRCVPLTFGIASLYIAEKGA